MKRPSRLPRREFLGLLATCGVVGGAGVGGLHCWLGSRITRGSEASLSLEKATCADFSPCLGDSFRICAQAGQRFPVKLVQAHELQSPSPARRGMRQPFSLMFRAPSADGLTAQIYQVEHPRLGTFPM